MATKNKRITSVKATTLALYEGVFAALIGLVIAFIVGLKSSIDVAQQTESVLGGLTFGLTAGVVTIIVVPLIYFGIGWIIGLIHGFVFNIVSQTSGGIVIKLEDE